MSSSSSSFSHWVHEPPQGANAGGKRRNAGNGREAGWADGTQQAPARAPGTQGQAARAPYSRRLETPVEPARLGTGGGSTPPRAPDGKMAQGRLDGRDGPGVRRRGL
jgi:hypothetical protein